MTAAVSHATMQDVIARALSRWPEHKPRIERAAALIWLDAVSTAPDGYRVKSQTTAGTAYAITIDGCDCPDARRHPGRTCKHRWAADLLVIAAEREKRLAERSARRTGWPTALTARPRIGIYGWSPR